MEKEKREARYCTAKPLLNSHSMQLLNHYKPIQHRYPTVLEEKRRKIEMALQEKKAKEVEE